MGALAPIPINLATPLVRTLSELIGVEEKL